MFLNAGVFPAFSFLGYCKSGYGIFAIDELQPVTATKLKCKKKCRQISVIRIRCEKFIQMFILFCIKHVKLSYIYNLNM